MYLKKLIIYERRKSKVYADGGVHVPVCGLHIPKYPRYEGQDARIDQSIVYAGDLVDVNGYICIEGICFEPFKILLNLK